MGMLVNGGGQQAPTQWTRVEGRRDRTCDRHAQDTGVLTQPHQITQTGLAGFGELQTLLTALLDALEGHAWDPRYTTTVRRRAADSVAGDAHTTEPRPEGTDGFRSKL